MVQGAGCHSVLSGMTFFVIFDILNLLFVFTFLNAFIAAKGIPVSHLKTGTVAAADEWRETCIHIRKIRGQRFTKF
jgi:hypothetical protein